MVYFTAHTFKCVCHCIRAMFRVLGVYNFAGSPFLPIRAIAQNCKFHKLDTNATKVTT